MITIAHSEGARVVVGVDTHKDEHVAVAIDGLGTRLGEHQLWSTPTGYAGLERWTTDLGDVAAFGVEGTGSFGAGLARFLSARGPDTSGSSRSAVPTDPLAADLAKTIPSMPKRSRCIGVLASVAQGSPKSGTHGVEMIRVLKVAKDSALKARTQAVNQMKALVVTAPADLRAALDGLSASRLARRCAGFRPGDVVTPAAATKLALRSIARRHQQLTAELKAIDAELARIITETAPALLQAFCVGPDTAATLLITAGNNPERLKSEAAFAALCGVSPIPAPTGRGPTDTGSIEAAIGEPMPLSIAW